MTVFKNKEALIEGLIRPEDKVLDVGFWGQEVDQNDLKWVHRLVVNRAKEVWGIDLDYEAQALPQDSSRYLRKSAEDFSLPERFSLVFAGDLIEHLSNPGLFLKRADEHLEPSGRIILTTPNAFNLFSLIEKVVKGEPTVNKDHTCYFNLRTLKQLLKKNGWKINEVHYLYSLELPFEESLWKKLQNALYKLLSLFTTSYLETFVVVAVKEPQK